MTNAITYTRTDRNMIRVDCNGAFAGWLSRSTHRPTGLSGERYEIWEGKICGAEVRANTITAAKAKIAAQATR